MVGSEQPALHRIPEIQDPDQQSSDIDVKFLVQMLAGHYHID